MKELTETQSNALYELKEITPEGYWVNLEVYNHDPDPRITIGTRGEKRPDIAFWSIDFELSIESARDYIKQLPNDTK